MAEKVVKRSMKGLLKGPRTIVTDELKKELIKDSIDHSIRWLANKYHIDRATVKKLIEKNPIPPAITVRQDFDPIKRTELIAGDSARVLELTIYSMKALLEMEIENKRIDPTLKPTITVKDLKDFFETVAPYVLQKVETVTGKKAEKTPMAKVHNMFAKKTGS